MSREDYERFVFRAGQLDVDDPVARWREIGRGIDRIADFLETVSELRVVAPGTDLTLRVGGRKWLRSQGHHNFPDGETFTGPVEDSVDGTITFSYPGLYRGQEADGIRLRFEAGEVVEATAREGEQFLRQMLALDEGARRVGEFAFGLNDAIDVFTRNTLYDEKIGGTIHLALGSSYPETGGRNESGLHWDIVCDMRAGSEVYADDELVYRDGRFLEGLL
jgi:aminopeptidase